MGIQLREFAAWARNRKILATLLVTVTLALGMLIGTVISGHVGAAHPAAAVGGTPLAIPDPVQLSSAFASIVKQVQPAVVNISTTQVIDQHGKGRRATGHGIVVGSSARRKIRARTRINNPFRIFSIGSLISRTRVRPPSEAWARA